MLKLLTTIKNHFKMVMTSKELLQSSKKKL